MMNPVSMAMATITVMLWLMWSDTIRPRRPAPILYAVRVALYLIVSGILVLNLIRYPHLFNGAGRALCIVAVVVGLIGAGYFGRRMALRR
jgi:hypothetical protein